MVEAGAPLEAPEATRYKEATKAMEAVEAVEDLQTKRPLQRHIDCRLCISLPSQVLRLQPIEINLKALPKDFKCVFLS